MSVTQSDVCDIFGCKYGCLIVISMAPDRNPTLGPASPIWGRRVGNGAQGAGGSRESLGPWGSTPTSHPSPGSPRGPWALWAPGGRDSGRPYCPGTTYVRIRQKHKNEPNPTFAIGLLSISNRYENAPREIPYRGEKQQKLNSFSPRDHPAGSKQQLK